MKIYIPSWVFVGIYLTVFQLIVPMDLLWYQRALMVGGSMLLTYLSIEFFSYNEDDLPPGAY